MKLAFKEKTLNVNNMISQFPTLCELFEDALIQSAIVSMDWWNKSANQNLEIHSEHNVITNKH